MKIKTVEVNGATYGVVSDGKPVFVEDDGSEVAIDVANTKATISRLNGEAKGHRERAEKAEAALKVFEGLDPAAARDALDKMSRLDAKKLVEAGDMDAAIQAAIKPYAEKLGAADAKIGELTGSLNKEVIGNRFGMSKFAAEKLTPAGVDLIRAMYADKIKVEGGAVVGYDANGQKIYSRSRPGEVADFDEVISAFVESYPYKEHIMKGTGHSGGGAQPGKGQPGAKVMTRAEYDKMSPADRAAKFKDGYKVSDAA